MAAERSPPRRVCGYRQTMPRAPVPLYFIANALISLGRRQWHQSDVAPIALGLGYRLSAVVLSTSLRLGSSRLLRSTCSPGSPAAATGRDRGSPPRASNLSCAARFRASFREQARIRSNTLLLEHRK